MQFVINRKGSSATQIVESENLTDACEKLSENGMYPLDVKRVETPAEPIINPTPSPSFSSFSGPLVTDATAKARIEAQHAALISGGVTVNAKEQLFETGTRMAAEGYATQAKRKAEHDRMLNVRDAGDALMNLVQNERRRDVVVSAREFANGLHANGKITVNGHAIGEQAIRGLASRLESPMLGYVLGVRDRMAERKRHAKYPIDKAAIDQQNDEDRAKIAEVLRHECLQNPGQAFKLRLRDVGASGKPDCFAIVGEGYAPADAPEAIGQLLGQLPDDARATYAYDPDTTTWELRASVWTPTPVAEQAVGEAFEGYVSFSSKDNGTSRFRGGGGVTLLRCLNASTYVAEGSNVARVHRGRILYAVGRMVADSMRAIDALTRAWGTNRTIEIEAPTEYKGKKVTIEQAIPGFYMAMLRGKQSELVGVLPGQTRTHAAGLTRAFFGERREPAKLIRSDLAQGWTKYIQGQPSDVRRDAEKAIGDWLMNPGTVMKCDLT